MLIGFTLTNFTNAGLVRYKGQDCDERSVQVHDQSDVRTQPEELGEVISNRFTGKEPVRCQLPWGLFVLVASFFLDGWIVMCRDPSFWFFMLPVIYCKGPHY